MPRLRSLLGSGNVPKKDRPAPLKTFTLAVPVYDGPTVNDTPQEKLARKFQKLYISMERSNGRFIKPTKSMLTCFQRLAIQILDRTDDDLPFDPASYVLAHKRRYGKYLKPNHFLTKNSWTLYENYVAEMNMPMLKYTETDAQNYAQAVLQHLSAIRGESAAAVLSLLADFGLSLA